MAYRSYLLTTTTTTTMDNHVTAVAMLTYSYSS